MKKTAQKIAKLKAKIMRDWFYLIKIDNTNKAAVLNQNGTIQQKTVKIFSKKNGIHIAKII